MKQKSLTLVLAIAGVFSFVTPVMAQDTSQADYIKLECADGSSRLISALNLTMTIRDGSLVASNGSENLSIDLANLASLTFSNSQQGIASIDPDTAVGPFEVFSIDGVLQTTVNSIDQCHRTLPPGVYILKCDKGSFKFAVM